MFDWLRKLSVDYERLRKDFATMSNTEIMRKLYRLKLINAREPRFVYDKPKVELTDLSRIEGMLLGIAIGDALGNTTEFVPPRERVLRYGEIDDYLPNKHAGYRRLGLPSDDTQLSFDTLIVILERGRLDMEELARIFASHRIFGIGGTVRAFLRNYKDRHKPWFVSGVDSLGNGALMRIAPVVVASLGNPEENLWADTILATMMTHNNPVCIGISVAYIDLIRKLLSSHAPPDPRKTIDEFADIVEEFVKDTKYEKMPPTVKKKLAAKFSEHPWEYVREAVNYGLDNDMSVKEFSETFGSSGHVIETAITVLFTFAKHANDPVEAMKKAVTYAEDNDSVAAILGAALGALHGPSAFKPSWIRGLSGRIRERDDGTVFRLIEEAKLFLSKGGRA